MAATLTTIRLAPAAKRRIVAAARRAGESPARFISTAALARANAAPDDTKLALQTRLLTGEEAWRELGLPD